MFGLGLLCREHENSSVFGYLPLKSHRFACMCLEFDRRFTPLRAHEILSTSCASVGGSMSPSPLDGTQK